MVAVLLLSGCAQRYDSPHDRADAFGDAVAEQLRDVDMAPDDLRVRGSFDGIVFDAFLHRRSFSETRAFIESARSAADDSPLGQLPVRFILSHRDTRSGTVVASVEVSDGRDLAAYRTQLVEEFRAAGFPNPG